MKVYIVYFWDYVYGIENYATDKEWIKKIIEKHIKRYNDWNKIIDTWNIDFRKWYWKAKYEYYRWWDFEEVEYWFKELTLI